MSELAILIEFKKQVITFIDELIEQFPDESDLIVSRIFFNDQLPVVEFMNHFIARVLPLKEMIVARDESFFIYNNHLFDRFNKDKVNHFKRLWKSKNMDQETKQIIWEWFDVFILISEKYQKIRLESVVKQC